MAAFTGFRAVTGAGPRWSPWRSPRRCADDEPAPGSYPAGVEILFTTLLVIAGIAILWFAIYVIYRLYADQR